MYYYMYVYRLCAYYYVYVRVCMYRCIIIICMYTHACISVDAVCVCHDVMPPPCLQSGNNITVIENLESLKYLRVSQREVIRTSIAATYVYKLQNYVQS